MTKTMLMMVALTAASMMPATAVITAGWQNPQVPSLDKIGTSGVIRPNAQPQIPESQPLALDGSFGAERAGFGLALTVSQGPTCSLRSKSLWLLAL